MNNKISPNTIALNKKARHEYFIEETYECGVILLGWEVKSLRSAKVQLVDSYITLKNSEAKLHLSGYDDDDKRQAAILLFKEKYKYVQFKEIYIFNLKYSISSFSFFLFIFILGSNYTSRI